MLQWKHDVKIKEQSWKNENFWKSNMWQLKKLIKGLGYTMKEISQEKRRWTNKQKDKIVDHPVGLISDK